jgi:hypothetical protein
MRNENKVVKITEMRNENKVVKITEIRLLYMSTFFSGYNASPQENQSHLHVHFGLVYISIFLLKPRKNGNGAIVGDLRTI